MDEVRFCYSNMDPTAMNITCSECVPFEFPPEPPLPPATPPTEYPVVVEKPDCTLIIVISVLATLLLLTVIIIAICYRRRRRRLQEKEKLLHGENNESEIGNTNSPGARDSTEGNGKVEKGRQNDAKTEHIELKNEKEGVAIDKTVSEGENGISPSNTEKQNQPTDTKIMGIQDNASRTTTDPKDTSDNAGKDDASKSSEKKKMTTEGKEKENKNKSNGATEEGHQPTDTKMKGIQNNASQDTADQNKDTSATADIEKGSQVLDKSYGATEKDVSEPLKNDSSATVDQHEVGAEEFVSPSNVTKSDEVKTAEVIVDKSYKDGHSGRLEEVGKKL